MRTPILLSLIAWASFALSSRAPDDARPNIIVFLPDTIRAESLSAYGHPLVKTPNVDRLAASGTLFEQAHVQHSQCTPSRCALLSGRYMHVNGHRTQTHLLQAWEPNMFSYLKAAGYSTLMLGKNDMLAAEAFNSSFTYWQEVIGVDGGGARFSTFGEPGYYSFAGLPGTHLGNQSGFNADLRAVELVSAFMGSSPPEPFAIWISGIGAHPPYQAPKDFYGMYSAAEVRAAAPLRELAPGANKPAFIGPAGIPGYRDLNSFNDTFFYEQAAVYLGRVSYTDYVLGALMDGLAAAPMAANTALIFSSDHGDYSGDWHNVEKYPCALDDVLTRVPLVASVPGGVRGARWAPPVESLDIFATVLDLAGLLPNASDAPTSTAIERHFSSSLLPALRGAPGPAPKKYVYSEGGYSPGTLEVEPLDPAQQGAYAKPVDMYYPRGQEELNVSHCTRTIMQRNATAKLVYRPPPGLSELYDLVADPRELRNVWGAPGYAALQGVMLMDLLEWLAQTSDVTPLKEDDRYSPDSPANPPFPWPPVAAAGAAALPHKAHPHLRG